MEDGREEGREEKSEEKGEEGWEGEREGKKKVNLGKVRNVKGKVKGRAREIVELL